MSKSYKKRLMVKIRNNFRKFYNRVTRRANKRTINHYTANKNINDAESPIVISDLDFIDFIYYSENNDECNNNCNN